MIPCIVLNVSQLPDIAQKTACIQMKGDINRYVLSTSIPLFGIGEQRYRQNNIEYHILRRGHYFIFDYLDNPLPDIVLPIPWLPDITQKTNCTQNVAMDVTFHLRYVPAF